MADAIFYVAGFFVRSLVESILIRVVYFHSFLQNKLICVGGSYDKASFAAATTIAAAATAALCKPNESLACACFRCALASCSFFFSLVRCFFLCLAIDMELPNSKATFARFLWATKAILSGSLSPSLLLFLFFSLALSRALDSCSCINFRKDTCW